MATWTTETLFNRETFEAWLQNQPGERRFDYLDIHDCLACSFIKETTNYPLLNCGSVWAIGKALDRVAIPDWLVTLLAKKENYIFTASEIVAAYQKLYGIDLTPSEPVEQTQTVKI